MQSVGHVLDRYKGFGPGFDFLRLCLALAVLWFHSFVILGTMTQIEATPLWYCIYMIMPMFFALSGFLVAGSALRLRLGTFWSKSLSADHSRPCRHDAYRGLRRRPVVYYP